MHIFDLESEGNMIQTLAIVGRSKDTINYENAFRHLNIPFTTTLTIGDVSSCSGLILPGGGDITPAFFGQKNMGSRNIDTELDILQLQALEYAVSTNMPVLGICKGMQLINIYFGGTIVQDMPKAETHAYKEGDKYHPANNLPNTILASLYGPHHIVNSAHHQCIDRLGQNIQILQAAEDGTPEAISHSTLPIYAVQWHPERLLPFISSPLTLAAGTKGSLLLSWFTTLLL